MAHEHNPLHHVLDQEGQWTIFERVFGGLSVPLIYIPDAFGPGIPFRITKFMILEVVAALLVIAVFVPLARRIKTGELPKGAWWNFFESILTFLRDEVAKPNLKEDADKYLPFLWSLFMFILFCNLLGMIPLLGSPTSSIFVTLGLALFSLAAFHLGAIIKMGGPIRYLLALWPNIELAPYPGKTTPMQDLLGLVGIKVDLQSHGHGHGHDDHGHAHDDHGHHAPKEKPPATLLQWLLWLPAFLFGFIISLMIYLIEFAGTFIKSGVLALRLMVNMAAGHIILASILLFVTIAGEAGVAWYLWGTITAISVVGVTMLSLLELLVAFLQAFVFTFLTALFLGMQMNPSH